MGGSNETILEDAEVELNSSFILPASSLAVCLVSGGMDSCVTAAIAAKENTELAFLHVSYGQRTEARERRAFDELADHYGVTNRLAAPEKDRRLVANRPKYSRDRGQPCCARNPDQLRAFS